MSKRLFYLLLSCLLLCSFGVIAQQRIVTDSISSRILGVPRAYTVILPKSYAKDTQRQYPVLYLLHGMWGKNTDWFFIGHAQDIYDIEVANGKADEMIIVTPNAGGGDPNKFQNGYFNMPGWRYEDFFFQELIPHIESTYRAIPDRGHRAVAGLSMGGGGATSYGQRHPDTFSSVYAMSALMNLLPDWAAKKPELNDKMTKLYESVDSLDCVKYIQKATPEELEKLRSVAWYVDCGDDDFLLESNMALYAEMRKAKVPCQFRVRDGGHTWEYWRSALYEALGFASRNFERCK